MIQFLSGKCRKHIAWLTFTLFYLQLFSPLYAAIPGFTLLPGNYNIYAPGYHKNVLLTDKIGNDGLLKIPGNVSRPVAINNGKMFC